MSHHDLLPIESGAPIDRRFIVNLWSADGAHPEVRSCEITSPEIRNRTSFSKNVAISDIFVDELARALEDCLSKLSGSTEVLSLPSFALELPGLVLAGAQIMVTKADSGALSFIFRFKLTMGGINRAFKADVGLNENMQDHAARLSADVMADIALPLLDICAAAEFGMITEESRISDRLNLISEQSHEIRFRVELLKRFLTQSDCKQNSRRAISAQGHQPMRASYLC